MLKRRTGIVVQFREIQLPAFTGWTRRNVSHERDDFIMFIVYAMLLLDIATCSTVVIKFELDERHDNGLEIVETCAVDLVSCFSKSLSPKGGMQPSQIVFCVR